MKFDDKTIRAKDDYEFWYKWVSFLEIYLSKEPLQKSLKHIYVTALTMPHEDPFSGQGFMRLLELINEKRTKALTYNGLADYKKNIKIAGWLTKEGKLPPGIIKQKKDYALEAEHGIRSITVILKLCVC